MSLEPVFGGVEDYKFEKCKKSGNVELERNGYQTSVVCTSSLLEATLVTTHITHPNLHPNCRGSHCIMGNVGTRFRWGRRVHKKDDISGSAVISSFWYILYVFKFSFLKPSIQQAQRFHSAMGVWKCEHVKVEKVSSLKISFHSSCIHLGKWNTMNSFEERLSENLRCHPHFNAMKAGFSFKHILWSSPLPGTQVSLVVEY